MTIYEETVEVPGNGLHNLTFTVIYKPRGAKVKTTFNVSTTIQTTGGTRYKVEFEPTQESVTVSATEENGMCRIVGQEIQKTEEEYQPKRGRPRREK